MRRTSGLTRARSRTLARCARGGSPTRATLRRRSGLTRARRRTLARCARDGLPKRVPLRCTSGAIRARSRTLARCSVLGSVSSACAVQREELRCPTRADPHGREAVRLLDVPATSARPEFEEPSCPARGSLSHTGEKPYACSMGPRFTQKGNVEPHERSHTGEKPCASSMRPMRFARKSAVARHQLAQHGI